MKDRVLSVVSKVMEVPESELSEESSPDSVPSWNSLRHMLLILALEEEFAVQFSDSEIIDMTSVDNILRDLAGKA